MAIAVINNIKRKFYFIHLILVQFNFKRKCWTLGSCEQEMGSCYTSSWHRYDNSKCLSLLFVWKIVHQYCMFFAFFRGQFGSTLVALIHWNAIWKMLSSIWELSPPISWTCIIKTNLNQINFLESYQLCFSLDSPYTCSGKEPHR